ncbi:MAG: transporter substrate-binding protein, partial [Paenibacillus sp.]|nr:transporter substrate-binding protein [Paenibacillus sp.]
MKKWRKTGAVLTAATITSTLLLSACSSGPGSGSSGGTAKEPAGNDNKVVELTWLRPGDMAAKMGGSDDRIIQEINKKLGIQLKIKMVPQNEFDKVNIAMASGDYPDIVTMSYPSQPVNQWIKDGVLLPINDYLKDMPTVKNILEKDVAWSAVDGKFYGSVFLSQNKSSNLAITIRQDWLDKLGLKVPGTLDELYEVLKAFRTKDPDGNGKEDTYGLTALTTNSSSPMTHLDFVFYAYGVPYGDWSLDAAGSVIPNFEHPAYKKGIEYLNKLYKEKLLDPEFMVNNSIQLGETKFYQSKVGVMPNYLFRNWNRIDTSLKKVVPTGKLGIMPAPKGPEGKKGLKG